MFGLQEQAYQPKFGHQKLRQGLVTTIAYDPTLSLILLDILEVF